jgi:drug/metabolite transporter (DMT)-like permease
VLIARPSFLFGEEASGLSLLYVGIAFIGAVCAAGAYAVVRTLRDSEHPMVIVFYFPLVATVGSIPTAGFTDMQWPTIYEWVLMIGGVGLTAQIAQVLLTNGLHGERAGRAMAMTYLQIVFAAIWGMLFFQEFPDLLSVVGAIAVIGGTIVVARQ